MPGYPRPSAVHQSRLAELASLVNAELSGDHGALVTGVTLASDRVQAGDLFAALPGARHHGVTFAEQAIAAGAVAILTDPAGSAAAPATVPHLVHENPRAALGPIADLIYGQPSRAFPLIGITGTAGKTTTAYLIESGLRAAGHTTALIGTVETVIAGVPIAGGHTTPEAPDLQAILATARERGVSAGVMEVSSHALALHRVDGTAFAVAAFTNLGLDHLDFHKDADDYFAAKARLFDGRAAREVVNLDDPMGRRLLTDTTITISADGAADATWRAYDITSDGFTQEFTVAGRDDVVVRASVQSPGRHSVANALVAIASLVEAGVDPATAIKGVAACNGVPGRMERVGAPGPIRGVVDYAHKPDAVAAVLAALRGVTTGRLICVIGAGGGRDRVKRPLMGAAASAADLVIVTDDNPRDEDPSQIRAELSAGMAPGANWREVGDRQEAIADAVRSAQPGDTIAVLGKGHEAGQETAGQVRPFDDRPVLAALLEERFGAAS